MIKINIKSRESYDKKGNYCISCDHTNGNINPAITKPSEINKET
jgi:hypothetical protein